MEKPSLGGNIVAVELAQLRNGRGEIQIHRCLNPPTCFSILLINYHLHEKKIDSLCTYLYSRSSFFFPFNYIVWSVVYLFSFREIESSHKEEPEIQSIEDRGGGDLLLAGIKISVMGIK